MIEVLVALAVMAVVLASIGSLVAASARGTRSLDQHLGLIETARAVEAALPSRQELKLGTLSGELDGHRWQVDVLPFSMRNVDPRVVPPWVPFTVIITVRTPGGSMLRLNTVRLQRRANG